MEEIIINRTNIDLNSFGMPSSSSEREKLQVELMDKEPSVAVRDEEYPNPGPGLTSHASITVVEDEKSGKEVFVVFYDQGLDSEYRVVPSIERAIELVKGNLANGVGEVRKNELRII